MDFEELLFWSSSNLIFTACVAYKIPVQNRPKMEFVEIHFLKSIFQKSSAYLGQKTQINHQTWFSTEARMHLWFLHSV